MQHFLHASHRMQIESLTDKSRSGNVRSDRRLYVWCRKIKESEGESVNVWYKYE